MPSGPSQCWSGCPGQGGPTSALPVVVDVALSSTEPGLPDHFFFLPTGRQSGTVRLLSLHHFTLIDTGSEGRGSVRRLTGNRGAQPAEPGGSEWRGGLGGPTDRTDDTDVAFQQLPPGSRLLPVSAIVWPRSEGDRDVQG